MALSCQKSHKVQRPRVPSIGNRSFEALTSHGFVLSEITHKSQLPVLFVVHFGTKSHLAVASVVDLMHKIAVTSAVRGGFKAQNMFYQFCSWCMLGAKPCLPMLFVVDLKHQIAITNAVLSEITHKVQHPRAPSLGNRPFEALAGHGIVSSEIIL